jgi:heme/copper-type cytochrome/quinol oxidase subunit 3
MNSVNFFEFLLWLFLFFLFSFQQKTQFCQPQGARIRTEAALPTFNTFVLTTASGVQTFGACITFYEPLV